MSIDKSVRLDKWLWAARFFKTRAIAKHAIDGGKVHCNGVRGKSSRQVSAGMQLKIRQGFVEKTVIVKQVSEQRGPATVAQQLYQETEQSVAEREKLALQRRSMPVSDSKPDKKQRRQITQFLRKQD